MSLGIALHYKHVMVVSACRRCILGLMSADIVAGRIAETLAEAGIAAEQLDNLAGSLVWRIGRLSDDEPVTVRLGTTLALQQFAELPRLRNASDQELDEAVASGELRVEWVGPRP